MERSMKRAKRHQSSKPRKPDTRDVAELAGLGLREVPAAPGSPYGVLVVADGGAPNAAQRSAMARYLLREQAQAGRYVPQIARRQRPQPNQNEEDMAKTSSGIPGFSTEAITRAHQANAKEHAAQEVTKAKAAAQQAQEAARAAEAARKARKAAKGRDVTPKFTAPLVGARPKDDTAQPARAKASAPAPRGRPRKGFPPETKFHVVKDPTKSGMSKLFLATATKLKKFTRAELVAASRKALQGEDRASKFFDFFVAKQAFAPIK